jgi:hypothetical protein
MYRRLQWDQSKLFLTLQDLYTSNSATWVVLTARFFKIELKEHNHSISKSFYFVKYTCLVAVNFISIILMIVIVFGILIPATLLTNISIYAQQELNKQANGTSSIALPTSSPKKIQSVKITFPAKGQQIPVKSNLTVLGTSIDNATSACEVSITLNGIKPYQKTVAVSGPNDYSKWNFTLTPNYATIKEGQNQLKAKFSCSNNPALLGHFSRNFTGIAIPPAPAAVSTNASKP